MKKDVYRIEVEVGPMEGTQLPEECESAFVNVYVGANDIREAIDLVEEQLLSDCYKPIETSAAFQLDLDETEFDTDEEGYPDNEDLLNIQKTGGVWYGPFNWWPREKDNVH